MNRKFGLGITFLSLLAVTACGSATRETLGISKKAPNEFMVMPRAPLSLPPEYDLRPVVENKDTASDDGLTAAERNLMDMVNKAQ